MYRLTLVASLLLLTACGGGSSSDGTNDIITTSPNTGNVTISATDVLSSITKSDNTGTNAGVIALENQVASSDGSALKLMDVQPLNQSTSDNCQILEKNTLNFEVISYEMGSCIYNYTVATEDGSSTSSATSVISVQDKSGSALVLPTITKSTVTDQLISIDYTTDLGVDMPSGASLDIGSLVVLGDGSVTYNEVSGELEFTGYNSGISRIYYTLIGSSSYIGIIEVSVSTPSSIAAPVASNIVWENDIEIGDEIVIDVADSVYTDYADGVQLVDLKGFDVELSVDDLTDLNNTAFNFKSNSMGTHSVTYAVSDHHGGFDIAMVVVNVINSDADAGSSITLDWGDITTNDNVIGGDITFLATPNDSIIDYMGDPYMSLNTEDGTLGPIGAKVAELTYHQAQAYCDKYDARLPLIREFNTLFDSSAEEVFTTHNWPTGQVFWTAEQTSVADTTSTYDLAIGQADTASTSTGTAYVTCVALTGKVSDYSITSINQSETLGTTTNLSLKVLDPDGEAAAYKEIMISTEYNRGGFRFNSNESLLDEMQTNVGNDGLIQLEYLDTSLNDEVILVDVSSSREKELYISTAFDEITINVTKPGLWNRIDRNVQVDISSKGIPLYDPTEESGQRTSNVYKTSATGKDWLAYYVSYSTSDNTGKGRFSFFIQQEGAVPNNNSTTGWISDHNNPIPQIDNVFAVMVDMYANGGQTQIKFGYDDVSFTQSSPEVRNTRIYQWFEKRGDKLYYFYSEDSIRPAEPKYVVDYEWPGIDPENPYWIGFSSSSNYARDGYIVSGGFSAY